MKKWIRNLLIILVALALLIYFVGIPFVEQTVVKMSLEYDASTLEAVYQDSAKAADYGIYNKKTPADYGFGQYEELTYASIFDEDIQLSGWWVKSAPSDTAPVVVLCHGRTANRLKPLKFLELFSSMGMDSTYNFFIVDFRNAGNSSPAPTELGNKFAEDAAATYLMLNEKFGATEFIPFAFSMGTMANAIMWWREDLRTPLNEKGIHFTKAIFDSPMSNVRSILTKRANEMGLPASIQANVLDELAEEITDQKGSSVFDEMQFSTLLKDVEIPILMLMNTADKSTYYDILKQELDELNKGNLQLETFNNPTNEEYTHVLMLVQHRDQYEKAIKAFL